VIITLYNNTILTYFENNTSGDCQFGYLLHYMSSCNKFQDRKYFNKTKIVSLYYLQKSYVNTDIQFDDSFSKSFSLQNEQPGCFIRCQSWWSNYTLLKQKGPVCTVGAV
jgi:hypothetical protein